MSCGEKKKETFFPKAFLYIRYKKVHYHGVVFAKGKLGSIDPIAEKLHVVKKQCNAFKVRLTVQKTESYLFIQRLRDLIYNERSLFDSLGPKNNVSWAIFKTVSASLLMDHVARLVATSHTCSLQNYCSEMYFEGFKNFKSTLLGRSNMTNACCDKWDGQPNKSVSLFIFAY